MSLLSENIIPGNHGKIFETNAQSEEDMERIKAAILEVKGVKDVLLNNDVFPKELAVHTKTLVRINEIKEVVRQIGLHAIPRTLFHL